MKCSVSPVSSGTKQSITRKPDVKFKLPINDKDTYVSLLLSTGEIKTSIIFQILNFGPVQFCKIRSQLYFMKVTIQPPALGPIPLE